MKKKTIILLAVATASWLLVSCKEYFEDLQGIGSRVERLEDSLLQELNEQVLLLQHLIHVANELDYVSKFEENEDGSYTFYFASDPDNAFVVRQGDTGAKGNSVDVGVQKGADGMWYWTINGVLTSMRVEGVDGENGDPGLNRNAENTNIPMFRIDSEGYWIYSVDGGYSSRPCIDAATGEPCSANGKDGIPDPWFESVEVITIDGHKHAVFKMRNGTTFTIALD